MIAFNAPWLLWGLGFAAVPLLLHLFARREPPTVSFPAVRYLADTARLHQRRLTVQHLLLLILRTLLIALLVLAAAGPTRSGGAGGSHLPSALVLVLDNSLSTGVTEGGVPAFDRLRGAARAVLDRATDADALWLLTGDGIVRRGTPSLLSRAVDSLAPGPGRLDLGEALSTARAVLRGEGRPGEVVVLTDLQTSALGPSEGEGRVTLAWPEAEAVPNAGLAEVQLGSQPWTGAREAVSVVLAGNGDAPVPFTLRLGTEPQRPGLAVPGAPAPFAVPVARSGWTTLTIELAPDELRLDDRWQGAVRAAPPAGVAYAEADRFLGAAASVLVEAGRIHPGSEVTLGALGAGASVVMPPADPALVGALNRSLAARGIPWRYGSRFLRESLTDSTVLLGPVRVRMIQALEPVGGGQAGVLVRSGEEPWLVRAGTVLLLASRLDTAWTELPLTAAFVPFVDALVNRLARGELAALYAAPGAPVVLPDAVEAVVLDDRRWHVEGGAAFRPTALGVYYLTAGEDTVGSLSVNPDPRESDLRRASVGRVRALWPGSEVIGLEQAAASVFRAGARTDLRPPLLWLLLAVLLAEAALAGWRRSAR